MPSFAKPVSSALISFSQSYSSFMRAMPANSHAAGRNLPRAITCSMETTRRATSAKEVRYGCAVVPADYARGTSSPAQLEFVGGNRRNQSHSMGKAGKTRPMRL